MVVKKSVPNITYIGGPFPGRKVHWPVGKKYSMAIRSSWTYGRYLLCSNECEAVWQETVPESEFQNFNLGKFKENFSVPVN